ncbi:MAG: hypothetical protein Fur0041_08000 [Bacteroidia bacterium]
MTDASTIKSKVRHFLNEQFSGLGSNIDIQDDTPLISSRLMDSIIALKLVNYLEDNFNIEFEAHEVDQDNLDSINIITNFVLGKLK